jgi:hypothetical protein
MAIYTNSFNEWLRGNWKRFYAALGSFAFVGSFKVVDALAPMSKHWHQYGAIIPYLVNAAGLFVIMIVITVGRRPATDERLDDKELKLIARFDKNWQWVWTAFFMLYLYLLISHLAPLGPVLHPRYYALDLFISNFLGNLVTVPTILCYFSLAWYKSPDHRATGLVFIGLILLTIPDLLLVIEQYSNTHFLQANEIAFWRFVITLLGGFISCVTLAMLAGRLESRVIGAPFWAIFFLYSYAALQVPLSVLGPMQEVVGNYAPNLVGDANMLTALVTISGWFLKALLFIFVYWLLDSGSLLYYLHWTVVAEKEPYNVDNKRQEFIRSLGNTQNQSLLAEQE